MISNLALHQEKVGSYEFLIDYVPITFLVGIILGYLYFRYRQISVGGTLGVGYLAATLYLPQNVIATILVSLIGYLFIRFVILKLFLPRPRQIFAIGLIVGIVLGGLWIYLGQFFVRMTILHSTLALVGVMVPGMLCNSLIKQGVRRTLVPLIFMVPLAGLIGFTITYLTSTVLHLSVARFIFPHDVDPEPLPLVFLMTAASVLFALVIQEKTVRTLRLRTGGYVTAGILILLVATNPKLLPIIIFACAVLLAIYIPYSKKVPLFGKDRFIVLCVLSFTIVTTLELIGYKFFDLHLDGVQNIVYCVLPAVICNDLVQYGWKRTSGGMAISCLLCSLLLIPLWKYSGNFAVRI